MELTLENERLVCENKELKAENRELRSKMSEMEEHFSAVITKLTGEIDRLKAQINKNSGNSSKPPSQDGFERIPNSREKSNRKSGGQPGHPDARLELPPNLDELIENGLPDVLRRSDVARSRITAAIRPYCMVQKGRASTHISAHTAMKRRRSIPLIRKRITKASNAMVSCRHTRAY